MVLKRVLPVEVDQVPRHSPGLPGSWPFFGVLARPRQPGSTFWKIPARRPGLVFWKIPARQPGLTFQKIPARRPGFACFAGPARRDGDRLDHDCCEHLQSLTKYQCFVNFSQKLPILIRFLTSWLLRRNTLQYLISVPAGPAPAKNFSPGRPLVGILCETRMMLKLNHRIFSMNTSLKYHYL